MSSLRQQLVSLALEWEREFGNAPLITTVISEYDAAALLGMSETDYSRAMQGSTAVQRGYDFVYEGKKVQVKGTRPSGKPGSKITKVPQDKRYEFDILIWVSYNPQYEIQEAWLWEVEDYMSAFGGVARISPEQMRKGRSLFPKRRV